MKSIASRFFVPLGIIVALFSLFILYETYASSRDHAKNLLSEQAALSLEFRLAIRDYVTEEIRPLMESLVDQDEFIPEAMSTSFISRAISEKVRKKFPDYITRFSSEHPRNPLNRAGDDELRMMEFFRQNPRVAYRSEEIMINGRPYLARFTPKWVKPECMRCHGEPQNAPAALIRRYGADASFHQKVGDVAGLDTVAVPFEAIHSMLIREALGRSAVLVAGLALFFGMIIVVFRFVVTRRLVRMAEHFNDIAAHGESSRMAPMAIGGSDEIALVAASFNRLLDQLKESQATLEQRVEARTDELQKTNEQLQVELSQRKHVEEEVREREKEANRFARENATVAEIGSIINSSLEIDKVYERFADEVRKLIPFDRIVISTVNARENETRLAYVSGGVLAGRIKGSRLPLEGSFSEYLLRTGQPYVSTYDIQRKMEEFPGILPLVQSGLQSFISVPLISKSEMIAILYIWSAKGPGAYTEKDLRLAARVGSQITSAIANSLTFAEQKRAEEALLESEKRFKDLYDNAPTGYHEFDMEGRITRVNRTEADMLGYSREEMLGRFLWEFVAHPEMARTNILARLAGTEPVGGEFERNWRRKDGSILPVMIRNRRVFGDDGNMKGIRSMVQDITRRKAAEQALKEKDEFTQTLLENSPIGIMVVNEDTSIRYVNPTTEKMTGFALPEILGAKAPYPWWTADPQSGDLLERKGHMVGGARGLKKMLRRKNGETFWVELTSTPLIGHSEPRFALTTWVDITERQRAEEEKEKLRARLQRAQKMEAIGTLAGGVAHDLNNILSGLVSYPDLLLMQLPEDSPFRKPMTTILESGKKAAAIVQDLLTLARRAVPITEVVNLNQVISEYLSSPEQQKLLSFHPSVEIETHLDPDLLNIQGSPLHLSKTIMNLVSNAAEAMPEGGKILVRTENRYVESPIGGFEHVEEGDYATVTVSDTGVGISPEDRERIFEPFYSKKVMGRSGTGLGMAVVWGTVKDHRGYIDLQSAEGKGTTFTLYFPVTLKEKPKNVSVVSIQEYMGKGESILVVDDVESQREIATALLTHMGYRVATVSSGEAAIEYVKKSRADLIVLDMVMEPGIDGLETYRRIRSIYPGQKAVIASGFSETLRVKEAQKLGAGQYIKKPYTLEKLASALRKELDG